MSRTSELVRPKWKWRETGLSTVSATVETKAMTSWFVSASISWMRSTVKSAFSASSSTSSAGISPSRARARQTASSTSSQEPVLGLFCPDGPDLRKGVALDHEAAFQPLCQLRVGECEYLRCQHCGVGRAVYRYRRDRDAGGHLDGGEEGVEAAQGAGGDGDAYDRQVGPRRYGSGEVSRHACGADEDLDATLGRGGDVFGDGFGVAVGGADLELVVYPEVFEAVGALLHDRQVGFAADKDTDARAQRSSNSMASMAMSVRYCMPSKWICSTAA